MSAPLSLVPQPHTTAIKICLGLYGTHPCVSDGRGGRVFAVEAWPWSGEELTKTHGCCDRCSDAWHAAQDAQDAREAS